MNCGGYLTELVRTKAGKFNIENSVSLDDLTKENAAEMFISPLEIANLPVRELNETEMKRISHGMPISDNRYKNSDIVFLRYGGKIHGVGLVAEDKILAKKVFEVL